MPTDHLTGGRYRYILFFHNCQHNLSSKTEAAYRFFCACTDKIPNTAPFLWEHPFLFGEKGGMITTKQTTQKEQDECC